VLASLVLDSSTDLPSQAECDCTVLLRHLIEKRRVDVKYQYI